MSRLSTITAFLFLSASSALAAGCMADSSDPDATEDETVTQAEQADEAMAADEKAPVADQEKVGEASSASSFCAPSVAFCPHIVVDRIPTISYVPVPHVIVRPTPVVSFINRPRVELRPTCLPPIHWNPCLSPCFDPCRRW
jgi:hypothetical protein